MKVSDTVVQYVQKLTVKQAKSLKWHEIRTGRITASKAYNVLHNDLKHLSQSLIFNIYKPSSLGMYRISIFRSRPEMDLPDLCIESGRILLDNPAGNGFLKSRRSGTGLSGVPDIRYTPNHHYQTHRSHH